MMADSEKLIFVYNADAGLFAGLTDFAHKVISPQTYACNLCKITYGNFGMKKEWKAFIDSLAPEKKFLHKNEFEKAYPQFQGTDLPAVFTVSNGTIRLLISAKEINAQQDREGLKNLITKGVYNG